MVPRRRGGTRPPRHRLARPRGRAALALARVGHPGWADDALAVPPAGGAGPCAAAGHGTAHEPPAEAAPGLFDELVPGRSAWSAGAAAVPDGRGPGALLCGL